MKPSTSPTSHSSTPHKLEEGYKQILVQTDDGATWKAEVRGDGLYLIEQLTSPTSPEPAPEPDEDEMSAEPSPSPEPPEEDEDDDDEDDLAEYDDGSEQKRSLQQTYDDLFKSMPKGASVEDVLSKLPHRDGMPKDLVDKIKDPAFRAKLANVMLDNKYDRKLRGRTRGKLDMGRLYKVPMFSRNIFTQKQSRRGKVYNVILLVDESGSMSGDKSATAAEATVFLLNALDGLNINTAVIGFNKAIMVQKDWVGKPNYEKLYSAIDNTGYVKPWEGVSDDGYNNDYDAMHFAYEYFNKAPAEGENILIMLSDGSPADGTPVRYADINGKKLTFKKQSKVGGKRTEPVLHHLVKSYPKVHSIGIGIFEGGWQIPDHTVVHGLKDLKPAIIKAVGRTIKRG